MSLAHLFFGGDMFKRILLKLSGEALSGEGNNGFEKNSMEYLLEEIASIHSQSQIAIVIGAGNIFRGKELDNIKTSIADSIGMLGTAINAVYLSERFNNYGLRAHAITSIVNLPPFENYEYKTTEQYLEKNEIVVFGGGTTLPYFTTDTAAAIRAIEINADLIVKATKVDGVYDKDPKIYNDAKKFKKLTFTDAISKKIKIMDNEAFSLCERFKKPILVLDFFKKGNILNAIIGKEIGTFVLPD